MFLQYYRLREQPFGVTPNPRYLYHGPAHREALASLIYGVEADLGFAALIAEPGMGKTTLLYYLLERFRSTARTAFVFQTQCDRLELLRYLANELEVPAEETDAVVLNERLREVLVQEARARRRVIVIIDEAQNLSEDALEAVRLLSDFETPDAKLMHIILSGQPELAEKLARPSMAQLLQRIAMLNRLSPFGDAEQVSHYLAYRLQVAGYAGTPLFTPDAVELISTHSKGVPRQINRICFNALSLGCAMQKRRIDGSIIREVLADLDVSSWLSKRGPGSAGTDLSADGEPSSPMPLKFSVEAGASGAAAREPLIVNASTSSPSRPAPSGIGLQPRNLPKPFVRPQSPLPQAPFTDGALAFSSRPVSVPEPVIAGAPRSIAQPRPAAAVPSNALRDVKAAGKRRTGANSFGSATPTPAKASAPQARRPAVPAVARRDGSSDRSTSIRAILLCAVGVPLLLFAAWIYMEKHHLLPGASQPATQQSQPADQNNGSDANHGTTVTLPSSPEGKVQQKPSKAAPGPRSEMGLPPRVPLENESGHDPRTMRGTAGAVQAQDVQPQNSTAQILVNFDETPPAEQD